jgi:hypothetical protein
VTHLRLNPLKRNLPLGWAFALAAVMVCRAQDAGPAAPEPEPATEAAQANPASSAGGVHKPFYERMFSLEAVAATVPGAIIEQVDGWPKEWCRTRPGFEKRLGSLAGQFVIGALFEDGVKAIHAEDTRYRRLGKGNVFKRTGYVIAGTVAARRPDGGHSFAWSSAANAYGSWAVATLWSPRHYRSAASILEWGTEGMGTMAGFNLAREFWPDVKSLFHKSR